MEDEEIQMDGKYSTADLKDLTVRKDEIITEPIACQLHNCNISVEWLGMAGEQVGGERDIT